MLFFTRTCPERAVGKRGNEAWALPVRRRLVQREGNTVTELTGSREPRDFSLQRVGKKGKEQGGLAVFPAWELGLEMQRGKSGKLFKGVPTASGRRRLTPPTSVQKPQED